MDMNASTKSVGKVVAEVINHTLVVEEIKHEYFVVIDSCCRRISIVKEFDLWSNPVSKVDILCQNYWVFYLQVVPEGFKVYSKSIGKTSVKGHESLVGCSFYEVPVVQIHLELHVRIVS